MYIVQSWLTSFNKAMCSMHVCFNKIRTHLGSLTIPPHEAVEPYKTVIEGILVYFLTDDLECYARIGKFDKISNEGWLIMVKCCNDMQSHNNLRLTTKPIIVADIQPLIAFYCMHTDCIYEGQLES